jgi:hypothetical protein
LIENSIPYLFTKQRDDAKNVKKTGFFATLQSSIQTGESPMDTFIPRDLQEKVNQELEDGERIEWIGMPIPRFFTPAATASFLFAIPWTAFALFWICGAAGFKIPDFNEGFDVFPLFGVPFVLIGFAMLASPLWAHKKASRSVYVITNRRAIIMDGGWSTTIRSYTPDKLQNIYRKERKDGSGDVIVDRCSFRDSDGDQHSRALGFLRIKHPKEIESRLKALAGQAHSEKPALR